MEENDNLLLQVSYQQKAEEKRCSRCKKVKPVSDFYRHKQWRDGFHVYCRSCVLAHQKEKREQKLLLNPLTFRWKRDLVRHDYFAQIDKPIKAYVLGVLAADGNVLDRYDRITLELSIKDANLLEIIRDELVPGGAITMRTRRGYTYQVLAFVSHPMVKDLNALGVTPAKSRTILWPENLPPCFAREFILGYFDGDGFITHHKRSNGLYPYIGFTSGSFDLLVRIADIIEQQTGIRPRGPWKKQNSRAYTMRSAGKDALAIDEWLHASGLGLKRKYLVK